jgi:hypothetical protein
LFQHRSYLFIAPSDEKDVAFLREWPLAPLFPEVARSVS